ncbi:uncharacterized protein LOC126739527 [Anthonomus grandis grandis]|uniref:uncharacterized protein LOC126739527 n=1 Tax=Anthonomus grandis grandis TaxID=2921223 RepID=UPI0021669584|nr:uncharacterized protein LOC126739527 [Anthonomus grandis grandis]
MEQYTTEQRVKIIQAYYENGRSRKNTFRGLREFFGAQNRPCEKTIWNLVQKFEQTGSVANIKTPRHARRGRSEHNIAIVAESVNENPRTSIRHRSQQLDLTYSTTQRILTKDLQLHPYRVQITQELKPRDHQQRRVFAEWIREQGANFPMKIIFSDEAHFHLGGFVNTHNCRIWGLENPRQIVEVKMHPQKVTVWCAFWSGGVIGPFFFEDHAENAVTVNGVRYRNIITEFSWEQLEDMDIEDLWF